jgi:uncharacterized OB-fold protein
MVNDIVVKQDRLYVHIVAADLTHNREVNSRCSQCGAKNIGADGTCGDCGKVSEPVRCMDCGAVNPPLQKFCGRCGSELSISFLPPV